MAYVTAQPDFVYTAYLDLHCKYNKMMDAKHALQKAKEHLEAQFKAGTKSYDDDWIQYDDLKLECETQHGRLDKGEYKVNLALESAAAALEAAQPAPYNFTQRLLGIYGIVQLAEALRKEFAGEVEAEASPFSRSGNLRHIVQNATKVTAICARRMQTGGDDADAATSATTPMPK